MVTFNLGGFRVRETDGKASSDSALKLLRQRRQLMSDRPLRIRETDPAGDVTGLLGQRWPLALAVGRDNVPGLLLRGTMPLISSPVFVIPGTREIIEFVSHPDLPIWVAKNVIAGSRRFGEKVAAEIETASPRSGLRLPTKDELLAINAMLADQLEGMDRLIWTSTPNGDQDRGESFILLRHGQQADFANSPVVNGPDYGVRFVKAK